MHLETGPGRRLATALITAAWLGLGLGGPVAAAGPPPPAASPSPAGARLSALLADHWEQTARLYPEWATWRGDHRFGDRLTDASPAGRQAQDAWVDRWLARARAIPASGLSATDRVTLEMFIGDLQDDVAMRRFPGYRYLSIGSQWGFQTWFAGLMPVVPMQTAAQARQLLARMAAYPARVAQELEWLRKAADAGWVPPRSVLDRALAQIDGQLAAAPDQGPYWEPFARLPAALPERGTLLAQGRQAIAEQVLPAQQRLRRFLVEELQPRAPAGGALRDYPGGREVYAALVRQQTTTALTPDEIHAIGQRELTRLRAEMESLMRQTGFEGNFAAFIAFLHSDPRFFLRSADEVLPAYRDIAKRFDAEMPRLFAELPRAPYGVVAMPDHLSDASEYYSGPSLDGTRGGSFHANVVAFRRRPV